MLVSFSARIRNGLTLQGGVNSGVTVTDSCEIREALPETNPTNPYCHNAPGWVTGMRTVGAYTVPKIDVLFAGTFRSDQGAPLQANYNVPVALISAALGRPANIAGTTQSDQPDLSRPGVGRSHQRDRPSRREGAPVRPHADQRRCRYLQPDQLEQDADLQPDVLADRHVADAAVGLVAAVREVERADRLLVVA